MTNSQIEFRGKSVKTGKWLYGFIVYNGFGVPYIIETRIPLSRAIYHEITPESVKAKMTSDIHGDMELF